MSAVQQAREPVGVRKPAQLGPCQPGRTSNYSNYFPSQRDGWMIPVFEELPERSFFLSFFFALTHGRKLITKAAEHLLSFDPTNELGIGIVPGKHPLMLCVRSKYEPTD